MGLKKETMGLLWLLFLVFFLGLCALPQPYPPTCVGGEHVPPRGRTPFVCTTLAAALVCFVYRFADRGGRLLRRLLLLGVALSAASSFLLLEPVVSYQLACRGWGYVPVVAAGVASMAISAGVHVMFAMSVLFDRD